MYDRRNDRGQGMRYQEGGYAGGSDGFMDRYNRMGQDDGYAQEPDMRRGGMMNGYAQGGMRGPDGSDALRQMAGQIRMQLDDMQRIYEKNAACVDEIREIIDGEDRRIRMMLEQAGKASEAAHAAPAAAPAATVDTAAIEASMNRIRDLIDERASEDARIREADRKERADREAESERRQEERANLEIARRSADAERQNELQQTLSDLQSELNRFGVQMDNISATMSGMGDPSGMFDRFNDRAAETDKNTHDVGVRIYRNVQASMNDYLAKQTSTLDTAITGLNQRMEAMEDSFLHRRSAATPLTVAALVTGLVNLGVLVVYILSNY
ncbi:MAG: hypothetical protein II800_09715 [Lachnospiraceae bacterium]|nr:hypothetical protein [Lachnospiraceae bacterium]